MAWCPYQFGTHAALWGNDIPETYTILLANVSQSIQYINLKKKKGENDMPKFAVTYSGEVAKWQVGVSGLTAGVCCRLRLRPARGWASLACGPGSQVRGQCSPGQHSLQQVRCGWSAQRTGRIWNEDRKGSEAQVEASGAELRKPETPKARETNVAEVRQVRIISWVRV